MLITKNGTVWIEDGTGYHVGTVNHRGRWRRLATVSDQKDLIRALPGWISQVQAEQRSRPEPPSTPSLGAAPSRPQPASKRPNVAGEDTGVDTTRPRHARSTICSANLCLPDIMRAIVDRMRPEAPWVALTRDKILTEEAEARLERVGTRIFAWSKGAMVAASTGDGARARSGVYNLERNGLSGSAPRRMHSLVLG